METSTVRAPLNPTGRYYMVPCGACERPIYYPRTDGAWTDAVRRKCQACGVVNHAGPATVIEDGAAVTVTRYHVKPDAAPSMPAPSAPAPSKTPSTPNKYRHPIYDDLLESVRVNGQALMVGPAGCGKSTVARHLTADLEGFEFFFFVCSRGLSEGHLFGRTTPDGVYIPSIPVRFLQAERAILLIDEMDNGDDATMVGFNEMLNTREMALLNRPGAPIIRGDKSRHYVIGAANTLCNGATVTYGARAAQDGAYMDRFVGCTFEVDYDVAYEKRLGAGFGCKHLVKALHAIRRNVRDAGMRRIVSTRAIQNLGRLHAGNPAKYTLRVMLDRFFVGWSDTEKSKALKGVDVEDAPAPAARVCLCGAPMVLKTRDDGEAAWACSTFPACRNTASA